MLNFILKKLRILSLIIALVVGYYFCPKYIISYSFSCLAYPFLVIQNKIIQPIYSLSNYCYKYKNLCNNLNSYKQEIENLKSDLVKYKSFFKFYLDTKELRDFAKRYNYQKFTLASILLKNLDNNSQFFLVDAGLSSNIKRDMIVIYKNAIIGRVIETYPAYSKVLLITDKTCKISSYCQKSNIQAIHEGCNNKNTTILSFVDHLQKPILNDLILSSGEGTVFPKGFALGQIKSIEPNGLYYNIQVKPVFDLLDIRYCYIFSLDQI